MSRASQAVQAFLCGPALRGLWSVYFSLTRMAWPRHVFCVLSHCLVRGRWDHLHTCGARVDARRGHGPRELFPEGEPQLNNAFFSCLPGLPIEKVRRERMRSQGGERWMTCNLGLTIVKPSTKPRPLDRCTCSSQPRWLGPTPSSPHSQFFSM